MSTRTTSDVLIVGTGIMGAIVARQIREREPQARILFVDAAPPLGAHPGQHMHDSPEPDIRETYNRRVSSDLQPLYVGPEFREDTDDLGALEPGMYKVSAFGEESATFPGAALAWNVGGMSVHWTAATPVPWGSEAFDWGDPGAWESDLDRAKELLGVNPDPSGVSPAGAAILGILDDIYGDASTPGRRPQTLPMAVDSRGEGVWPRTGPNRIFPGIDGVSDPRTTLRTGTVVTEIVHHDGIATGVRVCPVGGGGEELLAARFVVVCADALRTPQLLFASGIRPPALGRYLNEHGFISGRAVPALDALGVDETGLPVPHEAEWRVGGYWIPHNGARQPFNGEVSEKYERGAVGADSYALSLTWYVATEIRAENRVIFSDDRRDAMGMPRMSFEFSYSVRDDADMAAALTEMYTVAARLGSRPEDTRFAPIEPGGSLHYTGTVRMGAIEDGTSVCDPTGRVWGLSNVYVAGNGAIPTAVLCNTTLTGAVTAVRAGSAVAEAVTGNDDAGID